MTYSTWLNRDVQNSSSSAFLREALVAIGSKSLRNLLRRGNLSSTDRSRELMTTKYDEERSKIQISSFNNYIFGDMREDFILNGGKIEFGSLSVGVRSNMEILLDLVKRYAGTGTIVELGCGNGRNLMYLAKQGVPNKLIGFDLSPASAEVATRAADHFGLAIEFRAGDASKPLPLQLSDVGVVFTVHAFKMMPRIFVDALTNIAKLRPQAVIFLEPIETLWPLNLRGMISRLRVRNLDRLRHFMSNVRKDFTVLEARPLPNSSNPLNQTCLVVAVPK